MSKSGPVGNDRMVYVIAGVAGWFFCRYWIPETKGCPLEQIEANLKAGRWPRDLGEPVAQIMRD